MHINLRIRHKDPGHFHFAVFVGKAENLTHAKAGDLVLTPTEFTLFAAREYDVRVVDETRQPDGR